MSSPTKRPSSSTPLVARSGRLVGMLSTHYRTPGRPADRDLHVLDLLARQAADWIERARGEEDLRLAKEVAEAANRAKDEFLANVSHEIRTPLDAILGIVEALLESSLSGEQREDLEVAQSAAENLLVVINDLLDYSKLDRSKTELQSDAFSLRALIGDTLRPMAKPAMKKGLRLTYDVSQDVPDALVGDPGRLRQVLLNLIGNAIKFTDAGYVDMRVDVAGQLATESDVNLRFLVIDTGIGIPIEKQQRIFEAFEQEDTSTTRKYGGTGLGLTIAARLVSLMEGKIIVNSEPGRGSTFSFNVRFRRQTPLLEKPPTPSPNDPTKLLMATASMTALRVLVAEDNEFNSRHLQRLLVRRGYHVQLASNGREVLRQLRTVESGSSAARGGLPTETQGEQLFDVLLLDLHMPERDGFHVIEAIRKQELVTGGHLPVIALTARSRPEDRARCLAAGMDEYLSKPVRSAELFAAIDRVTSASAPIGGAKRPADAEESLVDMAVVQATCGNNAILLKQLCDDFQEFASARMREVEEALSARDSLRLSSAAHRQTGLLSAFSSVAAAVAANLEDCAARGEFESAQGLVAQLTTMTEMLRQQVEELATRFTAE